MFNATFAAPCLTMFCRLDEPGLEAVGQRLEADRAIIECRVVEDDPWCRKCGAQGVPRDTVVRRLGHEPFGHRPTVLQVRVRRYRCAHRGRTWRQDTSKAAAPCAKISHAGLGWALRAIVMDHFTVNRAAAGLGVSWHTANSAIIDLTPAREKTGPARLLDMIGGCSKAVFKQWLAGRPKQWRDGIEVVAMDGFSGVKTAAAEELPDAVPVMDPFHVVRLAGEALDRCRSRVQQDTLGHRGRAGDPLYKARRTLHTGASLLTDKQHPRREAVLAIEDHVEVEATWGIY